MIHHGDTEGTRRFEETAAASGFFETAIGTETIETETI